MSKNRSHASYRKANKDEFNANFDKLWFSLSKEQREYANSQIIPIMDLLSKPHNLGDS